MCLKVVIFCFWGFCLSFIVLCEVHAIRSASALPETPGLELSLYFHNFSSINTYYLYIYYNLYTLLSVSRQKVATGVTVLF